MRITRTAAVVYTILAAGVAGFQIAMAAGAPWGEFAMGGAVHGQFPLSLRAAALVQAALLALTALVVLPRRPRPAKLVPGSAPAGVGGRRTVGDQLGDESRDAERRRARAVGAGRTLDTGEQPHGRVRGAARGSSRAPAFEQLAARAVREAVLRVRLACGVPLPGRDETGIPSRRAPH